MSIHERIEINPRIMQGKSVIRGTRVPVDLVTERGLKPRARKHVERDLVRVA